MRSGTNPRRRNGRSDCEMRRDANTKELERQKQATAKGVADTTDRSVTLDNVHFQSGDPYAFPQSVPTRGATASDVALREAKRIAAERGVSVMQAAHWLPQSVN